MNNVGKECGLGESDIVAEMNGIGQKSIRVNIAQRGDKHVRVVPRL